MLTTSSLYGNFLFAFRVNSFLFPYAQVVLNAEPLSTAHLQSPESEPDADGYDEGFDVKIGFLAKFARLWTLDVNAVLGSSRKLYMKQRGGQEDSYAYSYPPLMAITIGVGMFTFDRQINHADKPPSNKESHK